MSKITVQASKTNVDIDITKDKIECLGQVIPILAIEKKIEFLERAEETETTMGCMQVTLAGLKKVRDEYYKINPKQ